MKKRKSSEGSDLIHKSRLGDFSSEVAGYTSSVDIDSRILAAVIEINAAHTIMLARKKIIHEAVARQILTALAQIPQDLKMNQSLEDVHMCVEDYVIRAAGSDAGGMINLGKSRNDQVATAIRMTLRSELISIMGALADLMRALTEKALTGAFLLMPGYTHLQRAQPITLGHHLLAYVGMFERDGKRILENFSRVNMSPMGAAALATSGFPLDRKIVAQFLGFDGIVENSLDAVSSRDFAIESIYVCSQIMSDLSKLAEEIILWTSKEYSFAEISDRLTATSSLMPQQKNAIVPEIARARASQVAADLGAALSIVRALPLSYNLDLQELTRNIWSAVDKTRITLKIFANMLGEIKFNQDRMKNEVESDETLFATELADHLVSKYGLPFRQAHARVGELVRHAEMSGHVSKFISGTQDADISDILGIPVAKNELLQILDPFRLLQKRNGVGSPNPRVVRESCRAREREIDLSERKRKRLERKLIDARKKLQSYMKSPEEIFVEKPRNRRR